MDKDFTLPQRGRPKKQKEEETISFKKREIEKDNLESYLKIPQESKIRNLLDGVSDNICYDNYTNNLSSMNQPSINYNSSINSSINHESSNPSLNRRPFYDGEDEKSFINNDIRNYLEPSTVDKSLTQLITNKYNGTSSLGQTLSHQNNAHTFDTDPNNIPYQNYSLWVNRKKRKNNPLLWQYINHSFVHPSKFSSVDYVQKRFLGTISQPVVEKNNYQILPLFLNSSSLTPEFETIAKIFLERTKVLCYDNVTVMQLKNLMKEFGLCHNGKKTELIERVKTTVDRIQLKLKRDDKNDKRVLEEEDFIYF